MNIICLLYTSRCVEETDFEEKCVDMVFADPPYFLSNDGRTCNAGKMVSVNKGNWDKALSVKDKHEFNKKWIHECYRDVSYTHLDVYKRQ